ncbi:MAG: gamma carbonic anhydrase family protein [Eggerthellaceae bacterium]|nr:gamma carbonic anhydrase family protein [Eggerthellaceae bacterium]
MSKPQIKMGATISNYHQVKFAPSAMLSPQSTVCGDVFLGAESSVFAGSQIRGDCEPIYVGAKTCIQENSCLHVSVGSKLTVGDHVTVGHNVVLHGCTIEDNVLVGMGSVIMDDVVIGRDCVIGAGSLITQGKVFEPRSLIMGSPAKFVRELTDEEIEMWVTVAADAYVEVARKMLADGLMVNPPAGANIWPVLRPLDDMATGMMIGGLF